MERLSPAESITLHEEAGEAFLLDVASGHYFGLNQAGVVVWHALADELDPVEALAQRWPDVPVETLRADANELIGSLQKAGLVRPAASPPE